jgi:uncharacterized membrane protein YcaP (DUF421 family)
MMQMDIWNDRTWAEMFSLTVPLLEKVLRPILVYLFLMGLMRLFGKREMAQLNPFDFIVIVMLGNTVQNAIMGDDNSVTGGLVGALALCAFHAGVLRLMYRHRRIDQFLQGKPIALVHEGKVNKKALRRELITMTELLSTVRRQGFSHLDEIERCTLEPGGTFSVLPREPHADERLRAELLARFDDLGRRLDELARRLDEQGKPTA